ncbi:MAG TPA: lipoyl(octanoyl) transferase LipB [Gammaproteobacteria bacterium]|nr:lipoyl(octanoyl) transferase LipB [Gammaproteobacteria bacterium]
MTSSTSTLIVRNLGQQDYEPVWRAMQSFNQQRAADSPDELWLVEHPAVFTLGLNGKRKHLLNPGEIPVIDVDRGGQVTYHGPGQLLLYPLLNLQRHQLGVRQLVSLLEQLIIDFLARYQISAGNRTDAPGVYVGEAKIAALGLRIKRGCSYHGLAFNINMDLEPFSRINPCGYKNMPVTQCIDQGIQADIKTIGIQLQQQFSEQLSYPSSTIKTSLSD